MDKSYIAKELLGKPTIEYTATIFLMGPGGGVMIESVWDEDSLLTGVVKCGKWIDKIDYSVEKFDSMNELVHALGKYSNMIKWGKKVIFF